FGPPHGPAPPIPPEGSAGLPLLSARGFARVASLVEPLLVQLEAPVAIELVADLIIGADLMKADAQVECDRGRIGQGDASVRPVHRLAGQRREQIEVQALADAQSGLG